MRAASRRIAGESTSGHVPGHSRSQSERNGLRGARRVLECSSAEIDPLPVLHLGIRAGAPNLQVRLTWEKTAKLVVMLRDTIRRFG